jgi:hypothetical protein
MTMANDILDLLRGLKEEGEFYTPYATSDYVHTKQWRYARMCAEVIDCAGNEIVLNCFYLSIVGDLLGAAHFLKAFPKIKTYNLARQMIREIILGRVGLRGYNELLALVQ